MGSTYCKECKIGCIEDEEIKRELCNSCYDRKEFGDCKYLYCSQCGHQAENRDGYMTKSQRERWICQKCNEKNEGRQCGLMCQRCSRLFESELLLDDYMKKFVNCTKCADILSDDIKNGKYKILTIQEKGQFLKIVYPPEMEDVFQNWMKRNRRLTIKT